MYNGFEPYQFPNWAGPNDAEPGMIKWLHLAGGYGHLKYWITEWQPCPSCAARGSASRRPSWGSEAGSNPSYRSEENTSEGHEDRCWRLGQP